ncbi:phosphoribosylanthranilate isomerase [Spongiibacter sp. KMU-158]|uniref:N-(5'-phosphoribosyl)anthranilate isomerase n=1 Tax=Spongiibacter pelagi TaxID=2760804 RepID=A0A927C0K9_9GAMM|nr:phosphoribosylanthranilate isomerase [Spongiibacter pelagi]MBD2859050.1 phosphoribosylanthranilate isomerase [Spongiibacter pelagi]
MKPARVKICGITNTDDALSAAHAGADAIGLVFYAKSPRYVEFEQARQIIRALPPFVTSVGLFVNADRGLVEQAIETCQLDLLQFHGDESPEFCEGFQRPYYKALRMRDDIDVIAGIERYANAKAVLLDSYRPGVPGGTGERFDWARIPHTLPKPLILAGGLKPENVAQAIDACQPWAVDVSGGVEAAPGQKSVEKMTAFMKAVDSAANGSTR